MSDPDVPDDQVIIHAGDCLDVLRTLPDESVDAVVTDPPYGLAGHKPAALVAALTAWANGDREQVPDGQGFMGKAWDAFVPPPAVWDECLRVLKPGGHLIAFAGSRTYDLMGLSIRMAGFEIRDGLQWLYGSGFPKSLDVSKAITATERHGGANSVRIRKARLGDDYTETGRAGNRDGVGGPGANRLGDDPTRHVETELTENGARWSGFGTALKPAHEPIVLARKPLIGTVAATVLAHGTGALNINGCRVNPGEPVPGGGGGPSSARRAGILGESVPGNLSEPHTAGRWPSNVLLDEHAATELDQQSGASRFFPTFRYQAKAPARERPKVDGVMHPTVKPLALMRWLVRLICPPGGVVLDPFAGSGTTLQAARDEGMRAIGIERELPYLPLIQSRMETPMSDPDEPPTERDQDGAELRHAYQQGWDTARADCWAPVQTRWRYVQSGDVVVDNSGVPWMIQMIVKDVVHANRALGRAQRQVDLDDYVMVLQPAPLADAQQALTDGGVPLRIVDRTSGES